MREVERKDWPSGQRGRRREWTGRVDNEGELEKGLVD